MEKRHRFVVFALVDAQARAGAQIKDAREIRGSCGSFS